MLFTASYSALIFIVTQYVAVKSSQYDFGSVNKEKSQSQWQIKRPQAIIVKSEKVYLYHT